MNHTSQLEAFIYFSNSVSVSGSGSGSGSGFRIPVPVPDLDFRIFQTPFFLASEAVNIQFINGQLMHQGSGVLLFMLKQSAVFKV